MLRSRGRPGNSMSTLGKLSCTENFCSRQHTMAAVLYCIIVGSTNIAEDSRENKHCSTLSYIYYNYYYCYNHFTAVWILSRTTWVRQSGFPGARESGNGIRWAICKSAPLPDRQPCQHLTTQFLQVGRPFCHPTNSIKALKAKLWVPQNYYPLGVSGKVSVDEKGIKDSWKEYMEKLMNEENEGDQRISAGVKGPADCIRID